MIDLKELEQKLDEALSKETESSLNEWLLVQRNEIISYDEAKFIYSSANDNLLWSIDADEDFFNEGHVYKTNKPISFYSSEAEIPLGEFKDLYNMENEFQNTTNYAIAA